MSAAFIGPPGRSYQGGCRSNARPGALCAALAAVRVGRLSAVRMAIQAARYCRMVFARCLLDAVNLNPRSPARKS